MAQIVVNQSDVVDAQNFLEQFLTDEIPEGDFTRGTALRDLTIGAISVIFAFLSKERQLIQARQSLKTIQAAVVETDSDPESLRDAVTALLSNFFIQLKPGKYARGVVVGHATQAIDIFIQPTQRFIKSPGIVFKVDADQTYFISKASLLPVTDSNGVILEYQFRIPLVALAIGPSFNIDPGVFSSFDSFSPYVTRIENLEKFLGGELEESTKEVLDRAPTTISVRNLINDRSIQAVLTDTFPSISRILTIGYGEPEMQRDKLAAVGPRLSVHVGGCTDIYLTLPVTETTTTAVVGSNGARGDNIANLFYDSDGRDFSTVRVGDILRVQSGLPGSPREFFVVAARSNEITVSERIPFPFASDEQTPRVYLQYTVGRIPPNYSDVISNGGLPWPRGTSTRQTAIPGAVTLPAAPILDIVDVAVVDPVAPELAYISPVDGFIHFTNHVNTTPELNVDPKVALQYQTIIHNPLEAQSARSWTTLHVGQSGNIGRYDGRTLSVRYRTLAEYSNIYNYVTSTSNRVNNANQLPRSNHPVVLGMEIKYRLKPNAKRLLNDRKIAQDVSDFINTFDTSINPIDVSAISDLIRTNYSDIASVFPFEINYVLFAPTGELVSFTTLNEVVLIPAKQVAGPKLDLISFGVSSRTVRYLGSTNNISVYNVGGAII